MVFPFRFEEWWSMYLKIVEDLNLDVEADRDAAMVLSTILSRKHLGGAKAEAVALSLLNEKPVVVFGAGPSLEEDVKSFLDSGLSGRCTVVAADGAARCLMDHGTLPHVVVTDLDGCWECAREAAMRGGVAVVHSHGDNVEPIEELVPNFDGTVLGTTQVEPLALVHNYGGFTDGDRAVAFALTFGAAKVVLAGMDFGNVVSKYSKPAYLRDTSASAFKSKKLKWGMRILERIAEGQSVPLFNATRGGVDLKGYRRTVFSDVR